ncbi:MAG: SPOR domain-containing protein [Epsilonproteobacteria bacterium]|nr:SPOR domain-containing protein [Campylobacterota bacterium]
MTNNNRFMLSSVVVALLSTGCVKPTDQVNTTGVGTGTAGTTVYTDTATSGTYQPAVVYEDGTPIVYEDPAASSGTVYGTTTSTTTDGTVVTTDGYQPATGSSYEIGGGAYGDPYAAGATTTGSVYTDPYASTPTTSTPAPTYTTDTPYTGGGIQLQVAALKSEYAAEEFKNGLSLDPKYSAYVKKGAMNKVIVTGFASRAEAKALAARQFPGAFIVSGSAPASTPSYSGSTSTGSTNNGIGVQVGAFSSQSSARAAAESAAMGRYTAIVKTATVRGKTMYKAILLGFGSANEARSAIASGQFGDAFVVTNVYQ